MITKPKYSVTDLGVLPGFNESRASALNDEGQVVGTLHRGDFDFEPYGFLWNGNVMSQLGDVLPYDINGIGQIAGVSRKSYLELLAHGEGPKTSSNRSTVHWARALNESGQMVGFSQFINWNVPAKSKRSAFILEDGERRPLPIPEGYDSGEAKAVNSYGTAVGSVWLKYKIDKHAVIWQNDEVRLLGEPEDFLTTMAEAVNDVGQILVRADRSNFADLLEKAKENGEQGEWAENLTKMLGDALETKQKSYLWHSGQWQPIDALALALNNQGQVVGWSGGLSPYAFLWQEGEQVDLNQCLPSQSGWLLERANDINNHGQIVGDGKYHGKDQAFLLTPEN